MNTKELYISTGTIKLKEPVIKLYVGNRESTIDSWVTISPNLIYVAHDKGSVYWMIKKIKPKISFNDNDLIIKINTFRLVFRSRKKYEQAKNILS